MWITFNEPLIFMGGYASETGMAPSINTPGIGDYLTARTVILAHANIYRMYEREFKQEQQGRPASKSLLRKRTNTKFNEEKIYVNFNALIRRSNSSRRKTPVPTG
jgi:beta-glucosidase/6-phospho-beta-glucosidase/beta-galactosidase